jgi:glycosyltransferase involved in cell wall biosynthesis
VQEDKNLSKKGLNLIIDSKFLFGALNGIRRDFNSLNELWVSQFNDVLLLSHNNRDVDHPFARYKIWREFNGKRGFLKALLLKRKYKIPQGSILFFAQPNIFHTLFSGHKLFRIHDFFPLSNPEWFTASARFQFKFAVSKFSKEDYFICNSEETFEKFKQYCPELISKAFVVNCPRKDISREPCNKCDVCKTTLNLGNYLLMVGTIEPRKNYASVLEGWKNRNDPSVYDSLVIVGKPGWKSRSVLRKLKSGARGVLHLENVCDGGLHILYEGASAFLSASLDEGFNLPLTEATLFGLRTILSDIEIHRSHSSQGAIFFTPTSIGDISRALSTPIYPSQSLFADGPPSIDNSGRQLFDFLGNVKKHITHLNNRDEG